MKTRLALICTVVAACDGDVQTFVNEGRVCADTDEVTAFEPGASLTLVVTMSSCISACPRFAEASCEAEVSGNRIVVHSEGRWAPSDEICIALCGVLQAECSVSVPEAGTYILEHGPDELDLILPSMNEDPPCTMPNPD